MGNSSGLSRYSTMSIIDAEGYSSSEILCNSSPSISCRTSGIWLAIVSSLEQPAKGAEIDVQVVDGEPEVVAELVHLLLEKHERCSEPLYLVVGEPTGLNAAYGLLLHQLPEQLHQGQHQLDQALLHLFRVSTDATGEARYVDVWSIGLERPDGVVCLRGSRALALGGELGHEATADVKLNGGHGPVALAARPGSSASHRSSAAQRSMTRCSGTSTASRRPSLVLSSRSSLATSPTASVSPATSRSCSRTRATRFMT